MCYSRYIFGYALYHHPSKPLNNEGPLPLLGEFVKLSIDGIVDVGSKPKVEREAIASGHIFLCSKSMEAITEGLSPKGDIMEASTIAAIQAVKETSRILPHCHPIPIEGCSVDWEILDEKLCCTVSVRTHWTTGVEMEALSGVSAGLLCAWDMLKSFEKDEYGQYPETRIQEIRVISKKKRDQQS